MQAHHPADAKKSSIKPSFQDLLTAVTDRKNSDNKNQIKVFLVSLLKEEHDEKGVKAGVDSKIKNDSTLQAACKTMATAFYTIKKQAGKPYEKCCE